MEQLDSFLIMQNLSRAAARQVAYLETHMSVGSTNNEILKCPQPHHGVGVLLAEQQTSGRGRRGKHWVSPAGAHIYMSVSRYCEGGLMQMNGIGLVVGISVVHVLKRLGFSGISLKWPNDIVVAANNPSGMAKLGGLLVECRSMQNRMAHAIVGLGLNVSMPSSVDTEETINQPWTDLATLSGASNISRNTLVSAILSQLIPTLDKFEEQGLAPFIPRFATLDILSGRPVRIIEGANTYEGIADGIGLDGSLKVLDEEGDPRRFYSGEVSVRAAA